MTNVRKFLSLALLIAFGILHGVFFGVSSGYASPCGDSEFGCPGDLEAAIDKNAADNAAAMKSAADNAAADRIVPENPATPPGKSPLMSPGFTLELSGITPTNREYTKGSDNIPEFLKRVTRMLLIVISTLAVLSIVIGGFYMATSGGDSEKANKGKIIITYNIIAIFVALFSFGIIQFVIWIIGA